MGREARFGADELEVFASGVFRWWGPPGYDSGWRVGVMFLDVVPYEDDSGTDAVGHRLELLKRGVFRWIDLALPPLITHSDIERVIVADSSGLHSALAAPPPRRPVNAARISLASSNQRLRFFF